MPPPSIPAATYRLQFNASFTFDAAAAIVDYLDALGISHAYASSYLAAVPGSTHGYDVTDPGRLNPELGDERAYARWVDALHAHDMGHIIDLVPNHMGIAGSSNLWWQDVLENGPRSRYAAVFDIDWHPLMPELENKVLIPILGDSYGAVLERQEIRLEYQDGSFRVRYANHWFPIAPETYGRVLAVRADALIDDLGPDSDEGVEWQNLLSLESDVRETVGLKRRLAELAARSARVRSHIEQTIATFNGRKGDSRSFDRLDQLLSVQPYRLAYWRVAAEEINYRRFFDINDLAAIRMEDPEVFDRVHAFVFELLRRGMVEGFRIDHVDGLYDPGDYLQRLQTRAREVAPDRHSPRQPVYTIVEKILDFDEDLPRWPVHGTTGYDFLGIANGLFVDQRNEAAINSIYERFTRMRTGFRELVYRGKQLVLRVSMSGELNVLAHGLHRFSERNRHFRDFTLNSLTLALREIIACFPVYRTYVNDREPVSLRDHEYIEHAVRDAKRRNPGRPAVVFDFVRGLLQKNADDIPAEESGNHMRFVGKFQQVTSPVTAKGIEDTALYIYNRLLSLNEVGSEPHRFGVAPAILHARLAARAEHSPHGLSASSTHDTKRSEDIRARLNVLSELPGAWKQATTRWARANRRGRSMVDDQSYPSRNEEYFLYQTLVGTWPFHAMTRDEEDEYCGRIVAYMLKAMREAKVYTSWLNPSDRHEHAMARFVKFALAPENVTFRDDFLELQRRVAHCGIYNSLAQVALKIGAPGVPDFYQGTELWDFSLVDPDNRRPVDYDRRRTLLRALDADVQERGAATVAADLVATPHDDRLKLYASSTLLRFRRAHLGLFQSGSYLALNAEGSRREHIFGFARTHGTQQVIVLIPRLVSALLPDAAQRPLGEHVWGNTFIDLPAGGPTSYRHVLTDGCVRAQPAGARMTLRAADVFEHFPIAFLEAARR